MQHALKIFPTWSYAQKRIEWHSRPLFHRDPEKSKVQPRLPINLPRSADHIPSEDALQSLCFVTGSGSDQPYFDLSIQLLESIKATRWYHHIPIKILDCGLNAVDKHYLEQRFKAEVKDPGWDIDPQFARSLKIGWKGLTARPHIHKHFPGFQYYFWMDTDTWIQNEKVFDLFVSLCEKQGLVMVNEWDLSWDKVGRTLPSCFVRSIPHHYIDEVMLGKTLLCNGFYCISARLNELYASYCDQAIKEQKHYGWGFDMGMLNYTFYKHVHQNILNEYYHYYSRMSPMGAHIDDQGKLYTIRDELIDAVSLTVRLKFLPYRVLFANGDKMQNKNALQKTLSLSRLPAEKIEQEAFQFCQHDKKHKQGSMFYRTFLSPEDMYGPIQRQMD